MFTCDKEDVPKSEGVEVLGFRHHLGDGQGGAQDGVISRESAVGAVVDTLIGNVERRLEADRFTKVFLSESPTPHRHRFKLAARFGGNELLEFSEKWGGFPSVECVYEAHAAECRHRG